MKSAQAIFICCPTCIPVLFCCLGRICSLVYSTSDNNDVASSLPDDRSGGIVLLSKIVASSRELNARGHVNEALGAWATRPGRWRSGDESHDKVLVFLCSLHDSLGVRSLCKGALGGHFCEQEQASSLGPTNLFQAINDAWAWDKVCICNMRPVCNLVDASSVLHDHRVANVGEFSVFED